MTFSNWATYQWPIDAAEGRLRVGQSYLNNVRPQMVYPELFHEKNIDRAWKMIMEIEGMV